MSDTKTCPFCAEEIKAAAIKCRYCQSDLTPSEPASLAGRAADVPEPVAVSAGGAPPADPRGSGESPAAGAAVAEAEPGEEGEQRSTSEPTGPAPAWVARLRSPWLVAVLSVLALLLAAGVGYLGYDLSRMSGAEAARTSGAAAAETDVAKILSYSYKSFDPGTAAAERLMTPSFKKEYADTVKYVRKDAMATRSTVKAQVVARSVVDASPDKVEALLFVNQTTTGTQVEQPRVDLNRVVVTMVPDGHGGWLVDRLKAL